MEMNLGKIRYSNTFRVLFIGFLILLLLIPIGMVTSVIHERQILHNRASVEIKTAWGGEQLLAGPVLTLPNVNPSPQDSGWIYDSHYRHVRPASVKITGDIVTQIRYRSIYRIPVYTADIHISGEFSLAGIKNGNDNSKTHVKLEEGIIQFPLTSVHALKGPLSFTWDDEAIKLTPRRDGTKQDAVILDGRIPKLLLAQDKVHRFDIRFKLAGSGALSFISSAQRSYIRFKSNWHSPGFYGINLPIEHEITGAGFTASWQFNDLLTDFGHNEQEQAEYDWFNGQAGSGVRLVLPVDTYQAVARATKYAVLFIGMTFLVYFFIEVFGNAALHPIQYLLVGGANCIFYLLLLSLAEHIPFTIAYLFSACASLLLITLYSTSILKSRRRALLVFGVLAGLYGWLYVTLRSESYALLIGSMGLFLLLSLTMYLTRNIDWHRAGHENEGE